MLKKLLSAPIKDDLVITKRGKPVAVLKVLSAADSDDWRQDHDPAFIARSDESRRQHRQGRSKTLEAVKANGNRQARKR